LEHTLAKSVGVHHQENGPAALTKLFACREEVYNTNFLAMGYYSGGGIDNDYLVVLRQLLDVIGQAVKENYGVFVSIAYLHPVDSKKVHQEVVGHVQIDGAHLSQQVFYGGLGGVVGDVDPRVQGAISQLLAYHAFARRRRTLYQGQGALLNASPQPGIQLGAARGNDDFFLRRINVAGYH